MQEFLARLSPGGPETHGLDYLRIDSQEGQDYLDDMTWCQAYAFEVPPRLCGGNCRVAVHVTAAAQSNIGITKQRIIDYDVSNTS